MSRETDLAWLAGFFEGEGSISVSAKESVHNNSYFTFQGHLTINQKNPGVLKTIELLVQEADLPSPGRSEHSGNLHLYWGSTNASKVLQCLLPYLRHPKYRELALLYLEIYPLHAAGNFGHYWQHPERRSLRVELFERWKKVKEFWKEEISEW